MRLLILKKEEYEKWVSNLNYSILKDPKGDIGVNYINCFEAGTSFPQDYRWIDVDEMINGDELIEAITGEKPILFSKDDINKFINEKEEKIVDSHELYELSLIERDKYPTLAACYPANNVIKRLSSENSIKIQGMSDGDLVLIHRNNVSDLISFCEATIRLKTVQFCIQNLRSGGDFLKNLWNIEKNEVLPFDKEEIIVRLNRTRKKETGFKSWFRWKTSKRDLFREGRPKVALLYTDEDLNVASYVRTHFDALDRASGEDCDVLIIENPKEINAGSFWNEILDEISFIIWKCLGWNQSYPYNKAEIYDIAKALKIPIDMLPCAVTFKDGNKNIESIIKLDGNLTYAFRNILKNYQNNSLKNNSFDDDKAIQPFDKFKYEKQTTPICFLSHNSNDKDIVRKVAASLHTFGIETWFDEWEIFPGDSIVGKIEEGLGKSTHLIVFLSKSAVSSNWVLEEINAALYHSISLKQLTVIPVVLEPCELPILLNSYSQIRELKPSAIANSIRSAVLRINAKPKLEFEDRIR